MAQGVKLQALPIDIFTHAPRVYSYTRFSTPEQAQGDSRRRQTEGAQKWTERKNVERTAMGLPPVSLDHKLNLFDLGVTLEKCTVVPCPTVREVSELLI